jgi:hypothetical protein
MINACQKAKVQLLIGYRMHFEPKTLEIVRMRKAGELGKVLFFQGLSGFRIGDPGQWRLNKGLAGGGSMMDIGIYSVNGARYMVGEDPYGLLRRRPRRILLSLKRALTRPFCFNSDFLLARWHPVYRPTK